MCLECLVNAAKHFRFLSVQVFVFLFWSLEDSAAFPREVSAWPAYFKFFVSQAAKAFRIPLSSDIYALILAFWGCQRCSKGK